MLRFGHFGLYRHSKYDVLTEGGGGVKSSDKQYIFCKQRGGVKKSQNSVDIIYGSPLTQIAPFYCVTQEILPAEWHT